MNKSIEQILLIPVGKDGQTVVPANLPVDEQIEYLVSNHFKLLASPESKLWRLENIYSLINLKQQKVKFKLNRAQKYFFDNVLSNGFKRIIILKSRQLGISELAAKCFLDEIIFTPNSEALMIAHTQKDATELFNKKIKYTVNNLPQCVKAILDTNTKRANRIEFVYPNKATSAISVSNSGRSGTYNYLHISELAKLSKTFPERAQEIIKGTLPSLAIGAVAIIESTAESASGIYYEMFTNSWKRRHLITPILSKAEFFPCFLNWQYDDEKIEEACKDGLIPLDEMELSEIDWKQYKEDNELSEREMTYYYLQWLRQGKDIDKLHQEFPTTPTEAFIGTGSNFFSLKKTHSFIESIDNSKWERCEYIDNSFISSKEGEFWFKEQPIAGQTYVIGADIAQGLESGDFTAITVMGLDKDIKAFYRGHCEPNEASVLIRKLGMKYNTAHLVVEVNSDGAWVISDIINNGYTNIYMRSSFDDITKSSTKSYGFRTDANSRKNILDNMKVWFNKLEELNCEPLLQEIQRFVRNKVGKPMAMSPDHDDLIFSVALALHVVMQRKGSVPITDKPKSIMELIFN
jgi:hypothetical protein